MPRELTDANRHAYDSVFQHPVARDILWGDVWSMLTALADAVQESNGSLKVTRNGTKLELRRPRGKDLADAKELTQVRHFLERSGPPPRRVVPDAAGGAV